MDFISSTDLAETLVDKGLCVSLVNGYFKPLDSGGRFEGQFFNPFDKELSSAAYCFTPSDLLACSFLGAPIEARGVYEILVRRREYYNEFLHEFDVDERFVDRPPSEWAKKKGYPGRDLYRSLTEIPGIGPTRATKLMARKRPGLFPIVDTKVRAVTVRGTRPYWAPLSEWLSADNFSWHKRLDSVLESSTVAGSITTIRAFDVIAWLVGSGKNKLAERDSVWVERSL